MKKRFTIKSALILAAVLCLTTVTVFAATSFSHYTSTSSFKPVHYTAFPTGDDLQKNLGFTPSAVEKFSKYIFREATVASMTSVDKDGKKTGDYKYISYVYTNGQGKALTLLVDKQFPEEKPNSKDVRTDYKGLTLSYSLQKYKYVPADYTMTEEEKKAQQSGEVEFSFGGTDIWSTTIQTVCWTNNGITYRLTASDRDIIEQADLTAMAKEIIDKSK